MLTIPHYKIVRPGSSVALAESNDYSEALRIADAKTRQDRALHIVVSVTQ